MFLCAWESGTAWWQISQRVSCVWFSLGVWGGGVADMIAIEDWGPGFEKCVGA
jgi:hypothetical protein